MIQEITDLLSTEITVLLTAMLPVIELRGAIPVGISLGMSPTHAFIISFIGSMIPVPFILFTIRPLFNWLRQTNLFRNLIRRITEKSLNKSGRIQKYGVWGLFLFVAIPLPGTGVWSGSLAAALLNLRFKWAFPAILIGNLIAGLLITGLSHSILSVTANF
ncbi:small multi-drug export protein [Sinanaerobacter sp. ZZT-01]|uniref:COG2426 family protein n=1 Tax=Sinanaerobacter sp. ZZT-01 TaxID=3111540 RepID=UPI002D79634E|nr:small multi-drug export protein [Sinanaerobacter sp. ZZT-01]WRR92404.1 small multi-drug export protein [Sinanaerobacter sp. ZZT-01]